jgi:hypothetical protein
VSAPERYPVQRIETADRRAESADKLPAEIVGEIKTLGVVIATGSRLVSRSERFSWLVSSIGHLRIWSKLTGMLILVSVPNHRGMVRYSRQLNPQYCPPLCSQKLGTHAGQNARM